MTPIQLRDYFRNFVSDKIPPFLWSDTEVFQFMDQAQKKYCVLTGGISDVTSLATQVAVTSGNEFSDLHPSIMTIRKAIRSDGKNLAIINFNDPFLQGRESTGVSGLIEYMIIGEQRNLCRWYPVPDTDSTVKLHIHRLPLEEITEVSPNFEIPEHHVQNLVFFMAYLAYMKQEADAFDPEMSKKSLLEFYSFCESVRVENDFYKHKPRTVSYGGI